jgi:abortive infection bacteriophage resistance protein
VYRRVGFWKDWTIVGCSDAREVPGIATTGMEDSKKLNMWIVSQSYDFLRKFKEYEPLKAKNLRSDRD